MDKKIRQLIDNGADPRELCSQGICTSFGEARRLIQNSKRFESERPPCDCGNPDAEWRGDAHGRREFMCAACHQKRR